MRFTDCNIPRTIQLPNSWGREVDPEEDAMLEGLESEVGINYYRFYIGRMAFEISAFLYAHSSMQLSEQ